MLVIGIAGGVASGKSLATQCFQHFGAEVLDADGIGHDVLKEAEVIAAIVSEWGESVLSKAEIDRKALGRIVFDPESGAGQLRKLESITHPRISQRIGEQIEDLRRSSDSMALVLDAPVMFKAGWDKMCDKIVFVDADESLRRERASLRGWSDDELTRREALQTSISEKKARSSDFVNNSGTRESLYVQLKALWKKWGLELSERCDSPTSLFQEN